MEGFVKLAGLEMVSSLPIYIEVVRSLRAFFVISHKEIG